MQSVGASKSVDNYAEAHLYITLSHHLCMAGFIFLGIPLRSIVKRFLQQYRQRKVCRVACISNIYLILHVEGRPAQSIKGVFALGVRDFSVESLLSC